jgi:hypothetical protein
MKNPNIKIKVVVQAKKENVPGWPHINFDYLKETEKVMECVKAGNSETEFDVIKYTSVAEAEADYQADLKKYSGVLVLEMTNWIGLDAFYARKSIDGIPCVIADVPFCGSGSTLSGASPMVRNEKLPVPIIASSNYNDIARGAKLLAVNEKLKNTTILVVKNSVQMDEQKAAMEKWGCKFINRTAAELIKIFDSVPLEKAEKTANYWKESALGVIEPNDADILESAKLYHAIKALKEECSADAVTIDCLGLSYHNDYGNNKHMYPCLSYYQMCNDGEIGVCEADINSTISSIIILYLTGRYGFVSDPVVDTSSDEITYAHCVACRKLFGGDDPRTCSFYIRSHAEDQQGASVQVIFPSGEKLTTINMNNKANWACVHSARSVGNAGGDAGCRSKLVASCNADNLLANWMPMWHRVTVFGDYRRDFINLFKLKGFDWKEEDK